MNGKFELHGAQTGNCFRAVMALDEVGADYSVVQVDLRRAQHLQSAHLALNPAGKVPTLVYREGGGQRFVLSQSNAITMFVDEKFPGILFPESGEARAIALERFFYFVTDVIGPGTSAFRIRGDEHGKASLLQSALSACIEAERYLQDTAFLAGDIFSAADIAGATFMWAYRNHLDWSLAPRLHAWFEVVTGRPSFKRGIAAFQPI